MRKLIDETFHVQRVLIGVHAAPDPRRNGRLADRVLDQKIWKIVGDRILAARHQSLKGEQIDAVHKALRRDFLEDRLAGNSHVESHNSSVFVEAGRQLALRQRMVMPVKHILLARPDQLDGRAGKLAGDLDREGDVVLGRAAPPKTPPQCSLYTSQEV